MSVTHVLQAEEIAEKLCESVAASLEGKKLGSFTRISSTVQVRELGPSFIYRVEYLVALKYLHLEEQCHLRSVQIQGV